MRKFLIFFAVFSFFLLLGWAHAADVDVSIPGGSTLKDNPGAWVGGFYQFSLMIAGLLAFGMIVYAGLRYTFAAGNPSTQSDARDQILQALLGVLLLLGAFIVLTTINPGLVNLQLPELKKIENTTNTSNSPSASTTRFKCPTGASGEGCYDSSQECSTKCGNGGTSCSTVPKESCN